MKHFNSWVVLFIAGVIGIPVGMVFNFTLRALIVVSWSTYVLLCIYCINHIPKRLGLTKKEPFFDERKTKRSGSAKITGIIIAILSIVGGYLLYQSNILNTYTQVSDWASRHIQFEQGKIPCISLGEECK